MADTIPNNQIMSEKINFGRGIIKKIILLLSIPTIIATAQEGIQRIFSAIEKEEYLLGEYMIVDEDNDGTLDVMVGFYDFNRNRKIDGIAFYKILEQVGINKYKVKDVAYAVGFDSNEDGKPDEIYIDREGDGILKPIGIPEYEQRKI